MKKQKRAPAVWYNDKPPVVAVRSSGERGGWRYDVAAREYSLPLRWLRMRMIDGAYIGKSLKVIARESGITVATLRDALVWCLLNPERAGR